MMFFFGLFNVNERKPNLNIVVYGVSQLALAFAIWLLCVMNIVILVWKKKS
jgi:hypothetical protein